MKKAAMISMMMTMTMVVAMVLMNKINSKGVNQNEIIQKVNVGCIPCP
jgi:hypothetical protein